MAEGKLITPDVNFTRLEATTPRAMSPSEIKEMGLSYSYDLTHVQTDVPRGKKIEFIFQLFSMPKAVNIRMEGNVTLTGSPEAVVQFLAPNETGVPPITNIIMQESLGIAIVLSQILGVPRPKLPLKFEEAVSGS